MIILNWLFEEWLPVQGYEGLYEVSNLGRVKSLEHTIYLNDNGTLTSRISPEKILSAGKSKNGYYYVVLVKNGKKKNYLVHRLVAQAFLPNPDSLPQVNHKDENKANNCVWNLEWCSRKYNCNYGQRNSKIKDKIEKPVLQLTLDGQFVKRYASARIAQTMTNISFSNISSACRGKSHSAGGYIWRFA